MALISLAFAGCGQRLAFEPIAEVQEVTFLTCPTAGGGGDPVYTTLDPRPGQALRFKSLPVILMSDAQSVIRAELGPQPAENRDGRVLVSAKVFLERASAQQSTNPPSHRRVYKVVIEKLNSAEWHVP